MDSVSVMPTPTLKTGFPRSPMTSPGISTTLFPGMLDVFITTYGLLPDVTSFQSVTTRPRVMMFKAFSSESTR
ncbi:Uncharacterised protein [Mycobacterium tuberculosis]|nr:Uncharacterised protein [Mycobacterium tuberculosis]